jgi:hypothetical protein
MKCVLFVDFRPKIVKTLKVSPSRCMFVDYRYGDDVATEISLFIASHPLNLIEAHRTFPLPHLPLTLSYSSRNSFILDSRSMPGL